MGMALQDILERKEILLNINDMNTILQKRIEDAAENHEQCYNVGEEHGYLYTHKGDIKEAVIYGASFALQNQWISVKEALPTLDEKYDFSERYFVRTKNNEMKVMRIFRNIAWCDIYDSGAYIPFEKDIVTHWMPIPQLEGGEK